MNGVIRGCPHCDFEIYDPRPRTETVADCDRLVVRVTRYLWEAPMVDHFAAEHPDELAALGITAETVADVVQAEENAALRRVVASITNRLG